MIKRQKSKSGTSVGVGASSILVIFVVLSLVTFAVLSLVSAKADKNLSKKTVQHIDEYYKSEQTAYSQLADIDKMLADIYKQDPKTYLPNAKQQLEKNDFLQLSEDNGDIYVSFATRINQSQLLYSQIKILTPLKGSDTFYDIIKWQTVNDANWTPQDSVPVYK